MVLGAPGKLALLSMWHMVCLSFNYNNINKYNSAGHIHKNVTGLQFMSISDMIRETFIT